MVRTNISVETDAWSNSMSMTKELLISQAFASARSAVRGLWPATANSGGSTACDTGSDVESRTSDPRTGESSETRPAWEQWAVGHWGVPGHSEEVAAMGNYFAACMLPARQDWALRSAERPRRNKPPAAEPQPGTRARGRFQVQFHKTQLCRYLRTGCMRGDQCLYAHSEQELCIAPDLTKTSLCKLWEQKRCPRNLEHCQFAHGARDLRSTAGFPPRAAGAEQAEEAEEEEEEEGGAWRQQPQPVAQSCFFQPAEPQGPQEASGDAKAGAAGAGAEAAALLQGRGRERFQAQFRKTQLCRYVKTGCVWGNECPFAHSLLELNPAPDLMKTSLCKQWEHGLCPLDAADCQFAHGQHDLRVTNAYAKTAFCKLFARGKCHLGNECRHAHSAAELRTAQAEADEEALAAAGREGSNEPARIPPPLQEPLKIFPSASLCAGGDWLSASNATAAAGSGAGPTELQGCASDAAAGWLAGGAWGAGLRAAAALPGPLAGQADDAVTLARVCL